MNVRCTYTLNITQSWAKRMNIFRRVSNLTQFTVISIFHHNIWMPKKRVATTKTNKHKGKSFEWNICLAVLLAHNFLPHANPLCTALITSEDKIQTKHCFEICMFKRFMYTDWWLPLTVDKCFGRCVQKFYVEYTHQHTNTLTLKQIHRNGSICFINYVHYSTDRCNLWARVLYTKYTYFRYLSISGEETLR